MQRDVKLLCAILVLLFILIVLRNAWISDDAYITFRTVENFLSGNGLGYNPQVRVQSYTHPLWMFVLSAAYLPIRWLVWMPNGLYLTALFASVVISALTVSVLLTKVVEPEVASVAFIATVLTLSQAFIDFSTSGLENPLTHLLLALFLWKFFCDSSRFLTLVLILTFLALNRLDAILLVTPALAYVFWLERQSWRKNLLALFLGLMPLLLWELFSIFYYGFPFPNTAYAKLNTGIDSRLLAVQGLNYFLNSLSWDPLTLFVILLAGVTVFFERERKSLALYTGVMLYLMYIVRIGGDFMSGRFLTAPLLVSVVLVSRIKVFLPHYRFARLLLALFLGIFSLRSTLFASELPLLFPGFELVDLNGIADERLYYFRNGYNYGLVVGGFGDSMVGSPYAGRNWVFSGIEKVDTLVQAGLPGYQAGPNAYLIDRNALVDPLLARLPAMTPWRIGHFVRKVPQGYIETLQSGQVKFADDNLARYYEKLAFITSGPLWSWERIVEIWKFNSGQYDGWLQAYLARN